MAALAGDVKSIFGKAVELTSPADRAAYLDEACGTDPTLRAEVEGLLKALEGAGQFMKRSPTYDPATGTTGPPTAEALGTVIGPYKLLQQIGEGGMGTVYMAEQTHPVQRKVALKVIKAGMDSKQVIARFEAERQALAMMDHVNIARVLDAGTTAAGLPYFVMELVYGVPITSYCDDNRLTPGERLELFVPVCHAVQHAHQKGIIHRDIKPSNVLITLYDGKPVPKVIDFGVAKATEQRLTDRTLFTQHGAMVGTLEYMSPEQAETSALGADTRSDIFSLGVLLYELLTGTTPLSHKRLKEAAHGEVLRMIREEEAAQTEHAAERPGESLASISAQRHMEPAKLSKMMRGELDWIVMKTLEKDRSRRYETANGLAADVQRYLCDEPVLACPPSVRYRLTKLVRRNRVPVLAASMLLTALVAGIIGTTWGMVRADRARRAEAEQTAVAQANERAAREATEAERSAKESAETRLAQVARGIELLGSVFKNLNPRVEEMEGKPLRVLLGERLDRLTKELEGEVVGDPVAVARLQLTLGQSQVGLGYADKAITLFTKARTTFNTHLGPDHDDTLTSMGSLAGAYRDAGKLNLSVSLLEEVVQRRTAQSGPDHVDTLGAMNNLAGSYRHTGKLDRALPLFEEILRRRTTELRPSHPDTLESMNNLAEALQADGKIDRACHSSRKRSGSGRSNSVAGHPDTLRSMNNLAAAYHDANKLDLALPLYEETLKLRKAELGPDHPHTLNSMGNLATAYRDANKLGLALPLLEETLKLRQTKLGPNHPHTLVSMFNLAGGYRDDGQLDRALSLFKETVRLMKVNLDPDHPYTLTCMQGLASLHWRMKSLDRSIPLFEELLLMRKRKHGEDHPATLNTATDLAINYRDADRPDDAIPLLEDAYRKGRKHPSLRGSETNSCRRTPRPADRSKRPGCSGTNWRCPTEHEIRQRAARGATGGSGDTLLGLEGLRRSRADSSRVHNHSRTEGT